VADGLRAARHLRSLDAPAFELLSAVPVRFDRRQEKFQSLQERPVVALRDGEPHQVRASYFTYGPHRIPFELLEAWYRAYARFVAILEEHAVHFRLGAGDFLLYDNHRMLHARTAFDGARWVRGAYFDGRGD
jgi:gamma-butyrobetaine dioxygenase